jgi:hypothetical protein
MILITLGSSGFENSSGCSFINLKYFVSEAMIIPWIIVQKKWAKCYTCSKTKGQTS